MGQDYRPGDRRLDGGCEVNDYEELKDRVKSLEERMAKKDTEFAVINTKLTAILWGLGVVGTGVIGVLLKMIFGL